MTLTAALSTKPLREQGGYCSAPALGLVEIYGPDAGKFLQAQTTNDLGNLAQFGAQASAFLDRKAHVQAYFQLYRKDDSYRIIAESEQISAILAHLEKYKFNEHVEFLDLTDRGKFIAVQGPYARAAIRAGLDDQRKIDALEQAISDLHLFGSAVHVFQKSLTGDHGYLVWVKNSEHKRFWQKLQQSCRVYGLVEISQELFDTARIEAGLLKFAVDFSKDSFLPETGLDNFCVSYEKGCFLGQEVLARVKSQAVPSRGVMGITFAPGTRIAFAPGAKITLKDEEIGVVMSNVFSQLLNRTIAIAYLKRDYRVADQEHCVSIAGQEYKITITLLPFYKAASPAIRAQELYDQALASFACEEETKGAEAESIKLLRKALELNPLFEDAYEALAVILSRYENLDEAIILMQKLAQLNPDSIMSHTNLSVFYLQKGLKSEAEEEKAISMSIRMRLAAQEAARQKQDEEQRQKDETSTRQRMEMFKQVLAIDPNDALANYGAGSCYVDLGQYNEAVPLLEKALQIKPNHTVAYLSLAEACQKLGRQKEAIKVYTDGIALASKRGDMTPLKEMQNKLAALQASLYR